MDKMADIHQPTARRQLMTMNPLGVATVLLLLLVGRGGLDGVDAFVVSGSLNTSSSTAIVGKFAFAQSRFDNGVNDPGEVAYRIQYPRDLENLAILFFFQGFDDWNGIVESDTSCQQWLSYVGDRGAGFKLASGPNEDDGDSPGRLNTGLINIGFSTSTTRYFFFMLVNCAPCADLAEDEDCAHAEGPLQGITFTIGAANPVLAPFQAVSYDEVYAVPFAFAAVVVVLAYLVVQTVASVKLYKAGMFHHTVTSVSYTHLTLPTKRIV